MHNILLQPSYPTTELARDEGHDVHYSGGGINLLLEVNYEYNLTSSIGI